MPGTSHLPALRAPGSGLREPWSTFVSHRLTKVDHASVGPEEDGRKGDVPGISVTRSFFGDDPVALPSRSRGARVKLPPLLTSPAVSATATACQGRGRDGHGPSPGRQPDPAPSLPPGDSFPPAPSL